MSLLLRWFLIINMKRKIVQRQETDEIFSVLLIFIFKISLFRCLFSFPDPRFYDLTSWGGISAHFRYRRKKGSRYARNPRLTHKQSLTSHPFFSKPEPYEIIIVAGNCDDVGKVLLMAREFSQTEMFPKPFFTLKKPSRQSSHHPTPRPCRRINSIIKRALPTHDARFARSTIARGNYCWVLIAERINIGITVAHVVRELFRVKTFWYLSATNCDVESVDSTGFIWMLHGEVFLGNFN